MGRLVAAVVWLVPGAEDCGLLVVEVAVDREAEVPCCGVRVFAVRCLRECVVVFDDGDLGAGLSELAADFGPVFGILGS